MIALVLAQRNVAFGDSNLVNTSGTDGTEAVAFPVSAPNPRFQVVILSL